MEARTNVGSEAADAREALAAWLRTGRTKRKLTLEDVAKITKIQPRILEKLESGQLDGLPADVFVKGFVRSFAKCVGLDESEALDRYGACQLASANPVAKALGESMGLAATRRAEALAKSKAAPQKLVDAPALEATPAPNVAPVEAAPDNAIVIEAASAFESEPIIEVIVEAAPVVEAPAIAASNVDVVAVDAAPAIASSSGDVEAAPAVEQVAVAVEQPGKKKRGSRKKDPNAKPRSRKKKSAAAGDASATNVAASTTSVEPSATPLAASTTPVETSATPVEASANIVDAAHVAHASSSAELAAQSAHVDEDAQTTQIERVSIEAVVQATVGSIETGPVAKTDAESLTVTSIEAKTDSNDTSDASLGLTDGTIVEPALAEGSDRMRAVHGEGDASTTPSESVAAPDEPAGNWQPTMPPIPTTPSVPWRRPHISTSSAPAYVVPTLVIDDADPDSADRERDDRNAKETRLSFLPPILLDREDRSARQGGLTLAVIILLIAATLTLSYLMRRPSPSGDGVTMIDGTSQLLS